MLEFPVLESRDFRAADCWVRIPLETWKHGGAHARRSRAPGKQKGHAISAAFFLVGSPGDYCPAFSSLSRSSQQATRRQIAVCISSAIAMNNSRQAGIASSSVSSISSSHSLQNLRKRSLSIVKSTNAMRHDLACLRMASFTQETCFFVTTASNCCIMLHPHRKGSRPSSPRWTAGQGLNKVGLHLY